MSAAPATRCVRQSGFIKVGEHMRQPVGTSAEIGLGYGAACAPTIQWTTLAVAETFPVGLRHWSTFRASPIMGGRGFKVLSSFLQSPLRWGTLSACIVSRVGKLQRFRSLILD